MIERIFRLDKALKQLGSRVPNGAQVEVIRFLPRRRALIEYQGQRMMTMLWCLRRPADGNTR